MDFQAKRPLRKKKKRLSLTPFEGREGVKIGIRKNGSPYSVRDDRSRYFFPWEWMEFFNAVKKKKQPIFDFLINTGSRIDEALHVRPKDFDWERKTLTLVTTKVKAKKKEHSPKRRSFVLSSQFTRRMKGYIVANKIKDEDLIFKKTKDAVYKMLRRILEKKIEIDQPWYDFALHNIRKTHGNYLKALGIPMDEICLRLGHDTDTYLKHYGSASIFDKNDKLLMLKILGDIYGLK